MEVAATFTQASLDFLAEAPLRDMAWLKANRPEYDAHLLQPLRALVEQLAPVARSIDPDLQGSVSRIYRDQRFHKGGPALRESVWITFQDRGLDPFQRPAFFFELYANRYRYGMGFYGANTSAMERIRQAIDAGPAGFGAIVSALPPDSALMGEEYRKSRAGHLPEPLRAWYDKKSFWLQTERPADPLIFSPALAVHLAAEWPKLGTLYRFLKAATHR